MKKCIILTLTGLFINHILNAQETHPERMITTGSLFEEMIDMKSLAEFPYPFYKMVQYSSYDHRSTMPGGPDWYANSDGFGGEPVANFEEVLKEPDENGVGIYLIADVKGPGAIVRLWTAKISGNIMMYIDELQQPVFDGDATEFFKHPYNHFQEIGQIDHEVFSTAIYQRDASYAPIPFAKRLRVIWTGRLEEIHFYQMQVRLYDEGSPVVSFSPGDIQKYRAVINKVTRVLEDPDYNRRFKSENPDHSSEINLEPGTMKELINIEGTKAIEKLTIRVHADDLTKALRQTVLHITFDEHPWGQVQAPVGDFFGAAPGINPYKSLPYTVEPNGEMTCRYYMPFQHSCSISLENMGDQDVHLKCSVSVKNYKWKSESMYFNAKWRVSHDIEASNTRVRDLPFLCSFGKGIYVGTTSIILNPSDVPTSWGNWWGEGDEKIFVDNEQRPSIFGTGSEDYYNYSWSSPDIFYFPYCGQPRNDGPGNRGFVTNYRWHILDPLPYKENIRFYMELYPHLPVTGLSYARIGYHYAQTGNTDDHEPVTPYDTKHLELPENWQPVSALGSRNAVFHQAENIISTKNNTEIREGNLWSGSKILLWKPESLGQSIDFEVSVNEDGNYRIYFTISLTPHSGKFSVNLDGNPIDFASGTAEKDLFVHYRTMLRNASLKPVELKANTPIKIAIIYTGSQEMVENPEIGIDLIWIQKLD